jgi:hypothetical protein
VFFAGTEPSFFLSRAAVKMSQRLSRFRRHLEGWELGVVAVGIAVASSLVAVPRAVAPDVLPVPAVDREEERRELEADRERARAARASRLPYEVRAVGEAFRRAGALLASGNADPALDQVVELRALARAARVTHGDGKLLELRALQTELFLEALAGWEESAATTSDLRELGGDFLAKAEQSGWIRDTRRLVPDEDERRLLFRARWSRLTGLFNTHPFSPTLNEWRAYYRFLLEHPESGSYRPGEQPAALELLKYASALERRDPDYPIAFSRGVLHYWLGDYAQAATDFRQHLARHPRGPWRLRAQNHLAAALHPTP